MRVTEPTEAIQSPGGKQKPWLSYAALIAVASVYFIPFVRFVLSGSDEGSMLLGAERIVHGQLFARDFFEAMGPGTFYLLAAWFKCFGVSIVSAQAYLFLTFLATAVLVYGLSRRICKQLQLLPCIVFAGTYFGMFSGGVSHHFDSNLYALLALVCLIHWQTSRKAVLLILSGVLLAVTTCIFQPKGALLLGAACIWLWIEAKPSRSTFRSWTSVLGSYFLVIGAVAAYFWGRGALESLIDANYLFPRQHYSAVNSVPYAFSLFDGVWKFWIGVFGNKAPGMALAALLIVPGILIALLPILTPILGWRQRFGIDKPEFRLLWLAGYALWVSEVHRSDIFHLTFGSPILIIVFASFLERWKSVAARGAALLIQFSGGLLAVCSLLTLTFGAKPIHTREGTVTSIQPAVAGVLGYLDNNVAAKDDIFVYPYAPVYYFLSDAKDPTPYSFLMYGYNTPEQFHQVVGILDQRQVRYVVWDTNFARMEKQLFPRVKPAGPGEMIMEPYLISHYREVADYGGVKIMERIPDHGADSGAGSSREK